MHLFQMPYDLKPGVCCRVVLFSVSIGLSFLNYRGLHIIGNAAVASTVYIIVPFVVLAALAVPHMEPRNWVAQDWSAVQWGQFINVMFWCARSPPRLTPSVWCAIPQRLLGL